MLVRGALADHPHERRTDPGERSRTQPAAWTVVFLLLKTLFLTLRLSELPRVRNCRQKSSVA